MISICPGRPTNSFDVRLDAVRLPDESLFGLDVRVWLAGIGGSANASHQAQSGKPFVLSFARSADQRLFKSAWFACWRGSASRVEEAIVDLIKHDRGSPAR
jgi:hypothetical protein